MSECIREVEFAEKLATIDQRSKSNTHRIEKLEDSTEAIGRLATCMEKMAVHQETMGKSVDKLTIDVELLKAEPGKRWKFVIEKAIYFVVAAVVGFMLAKFGLSV